MADSDNNGNGCTTKHMEQTDEQKSVELCTGQSTASKVADYDEQKCKCENKVISETDAVAFGNLSLCTPTSRKKIARKLTFRRKKAESGKTKEMNKKHRHFWASFKLKSHLPTRMRKGKDSGLADTMPTSMNRGVCVCTGYRRTDDHLLGPGIVFGASGNTSSYTHQSYSQQLQSNPTRRRNMVQLSPGALNRIVTPPVQPRHPPLIDLSKFNPDDYPTEDPDEILIEQRRRDMEHGIEIDIGPNVPYQPHIPLAEQIASLNFALQRQCSLQTMYPVLTLNSECPYSELGSFNAVTSMIQPAQAVHTQIDFIHCLVPDLQHITNCGFYWGVMDRYEAEQLLENKPEGTFLLRDSAQEEFLFSVSFRRYGRSLHARIEQWNHKFSFDSHDPGVFASDTVCGLIEHYKDPSCCMFFEPMLTIPLNRTDPFSLQHICRSVITKNMAYDGINLLPLPKKLQEYLKYYHYKQKVRVRRFDGSHESYGPTLSTGANFQSD